MNNRKRKKEEREMEKCPLPVKCMLDKWVSGLHVHILIGERLTKHFIKIKYVLKKRKHEPNKDNT